MVAARYGSPTYNGQIIVNADSGVSSIEDLKSKTFCRPDPLSTSGWIIPDLTMRAAGIDPQSDLAEIVDAGSHDGVVAGATYVDARSTIEEDNPNVLEKVLVIGLTEDIPNDGVQFIAGMDAEMKQTIVDALLAISETEEGQAALDTAYSWAALEVHGDDFYDYSRQVLQAAGLSITELQ